MSLLYVKQPRKSPKDKSVKFYPQVKSIKLIKQKEVAKLLSDETTLNPMEAAFVLEQLSKIVERLLLQSYSVQLGEWASFFLTNTSEGAETQEACTPQKIKALHVRVRFGKEFRQSLNSKAEYRYVQDMEINKGK
ncbi:MAG: DNA-binding protein [Alloprevotella sp.]|nr:DNA-binding protein [Alloprevotella sp.]